MGRRLRDKSVGWTDVVGSPDQWDKENLDTCIRNFMHKRFKECQVFDTDDHECNHTRVISGAQWIKMAVAQSKKMSAQSAFNQYNMKMTEIEGRLVSAIPVQLWSELSDTMPTIFRDKDHFAWFIKNFKHYFMVAENY